MKYILDTCNNCNLNKKVVISENKLSKNLCASCIAELIDTEKSADIRNLSMTLQIPFSLKEYYTIKLSSTSNEEAMDSYLMYLSEQNPMMMDTGVFNWNEIDTHYHAAKNYTHALAEITPLRDAITERGQEKWGHDLTFHDIVKLEQIYESTVKQYNITSALQQDAIKKAAKLSVSMDKLIEADGYKELRDATAAQAQFLKTANIDDLVAVSDDETIRTVADLVLYLEKNNFQFHKDLPKVAQDDIDELMENYIKNVKEVVYNATGLETQLKDFIEKQQEAHEEHLLEEAAQETPLDNFDYDEFMEEEERKMDLELQSEEISEEFDLNDDDLYY